MNQDACELVPIDLNLRFVLFGLQMALGVSFSVQEMERVFTDALANQVSKKEYSFHVSREVVLKGVVEDYEPETIWLHLRHSDAVSLLQRVIEAASYEVVRSERSKDVTRNNT